jgi:AcrR family transcriptional regulator
MQHAYDERVAERTTKRADQRRDTEARILAAARQAFAEAGYDRATIRAIAAAAGVNPGLVMHYFGSKEELFNRAASMEPGTPEPETPEQLAEFLLGSLGVKLDSLPLASVATLRSMLTHPEAAAEVRSMADQQRRQLSSAIEADDAQLRAALVGSIVFGVVVTRHLLQVDTLRDASPDAIISLLRPCFHSLTTGKDPA